MEKLERSGSRVRFTCPSIHLGLDHGYGEWELQRTLAVEFQQCSVAV
jgi:hypothetical protein